MANAGPSRTSTVAMRRIQSELKEWLRNPPDGCRLDSYEPLTQWVILMEGPESAAAPGLPRLYDGEVFRLRITFSDHYPLDPPEFVFIPPSPEHMHIYSNGFICLDILYANRGGGWSPAMTISSCCLSLRSMLASATKKARPPGDSQFCRRAYRSPKDVNWLFDDNTVGVSQIIRQCGKRTFAPFLPNQWVQSQILPDLALSIKAIGTVDGHMGRCIPLETAADFAVAIAVAWGQNAVCLKSLGS